jgi:tetratricopeptide (TPR) repeat protein
VTKFFTPFVRQVVLLALLTSGGCLVVNWFHHTDLYRERLYTKLLHGDADAKLVAASALAQYGGQEQLFRALRSPDESVRDMARRGIEFIWFNAAGPAAYQLNLAAYEAAENQDLPGALEILDQLVECYPRYAEGWNRRACVLWQMGQYEKSLTDCERALALNPLHYGAWQGIGVCHLHLGNVTAACRALRKALQLAPHDQDTRDSLERCEQLMRDDPEPEKRQRLLDMI